MTKAEQRECVRASLTEMTAGQKEEKSARIRMEVAKELERVDSVMSFVPTDSEPGILPLFMERITAYPCTEPNGEMEAVIPSEWKRGRYGIPEPADGWLVDPEELDLVLVPLTAFDGENNRLGRGGGYYDQYLKRCINARKVGIAFAEQRLDRVVTDENDVRLDAVIYA